VNTILGSMHYANVSLGYVSATSNLLVWRHPNGWIKRKSCADADESSTPVIGKGACRIGWISFSNTLPRR
jgi:hypothetical protein